MSYYCGAFRSMKQFTAIFLAVLIGLTSSSSFFIWFTYEVAQPYVEEMWCVNKDQPEKQCHGKCFLHQQLQEQQEDTPQKAPVNIDDALKLTVFYVETSQDDTLELQRKRRNIFNHSVLKDQLFTAEYFHPPQLPA